MKLLFVHQHLGEFGGAEANIHLAAEGLQHRGHSLALLYARPTGRNEAKWRQIFSELFCLPTPGNVELVEAVIDRFKPDLIYLHNLADLKVVEALVQSGVPVVRMVHDHALYCMRGYKYNYFTRKICTRRASAYCVFPCLASIARNRGGGLPVRWKSYGDTQKEIALTQQCQGVVVYSQYLKAELVQNGFHPDKIEICVPIRGSDEGAISSYSDRNVVLFAGQLVRGKGVDMLLQALARVKSPFQCLILGEGSHRADCDRLSERLGLANRVQFCGYVLPAELKEFYLQASVFVMSSLWPEPFGMAGPEAMRYGLPVVAFDAGGIREWLHDGQNGYLIPWKDTDLFAVRLDALLRNKELARKLGQGSLAWVKRYNESRQLDILERLFKRVLDGMHSNIPLQAQFEKTLSAHD